MKALLRVLVIPLLLLTFHRSVSADDAPPPRPGIPGVAFPAEESGIWLVEFSAPPTADGGDVASIEAEHQAFRQRAAIAGIAFTERYEFRTLWNGLAIAVEPGLRAALERLEGVTAIHPVAPLQIPDSEEVLEPALLSALSMTGADVAQNELGLTGAGIRVGIIDTGIDYDHPDLGGDGVARINSNVFPTARVVAGLDFIGPPVFPPQTDPYPDDESGHGTHVAGIIGANGAVRGVAPGVVFGAYRVANTIHVLAAMERALADGMHIVNISMGIGFNWPQSPLARAADRLVQRGVVVTSSMGNAGTIGLYSPSAPAVGSKVIGVASFDNTLRSVPAFTASPDQAPFIYTIARGSPPPVPPLYSGTYALATGTDVGGKVALYRSMPCAPCLPSEYAAALLAQQREAVAVVLYADILDFFPPTINVPAGQPPIHIPVVSITRAEAQQLLVRLAQGPVDVTWHAALPLPVASGGLITSTSSWGPSPDLGLKPDLGAPGGFMHSTYPLDRGGVANLAGTSMASAHVAGAAALLLEAHPRLSPNQVRSALQNTAHPRPTSDPSRIEPVHRQGGGVIDVVAAVQATTRIEPSSFALGESESAPVTRQLTISNESDGEISYQLTHVPSLATGPNRYTPAFLDLSGIVTFSTNTLTIPAGRSATIAVTIAPDPGLPDRSLYGGYLVLTTENGGGPYSVPYLGFKGDYQSIPTLTPTINDYPWLARDQDPIGFPPRRLIRVSDGWTFRMITNPTMPSVLWHLDHPAERVRMEVFDAVTGRPWHRIFDSKWWGGNSINGAYTLSSWAGFTSHGQHSEIVPDGEYVIRLSVLRGLGDENNPAHWEYWTSPRFFIDRPNLAVERLSLTRDLVHVGEEVGVVASIRNHGQDPLTGIGVTIFDGEAAFHTETLDLAAGETRLIEVPWRVEGATVHRLRAAVSGSFADENLADNEAVLEVIPGEPTVGVANAPAVQVFDLSPAQPNPFSRGTTFSFSLSRPGPATLEVFDLQGRRLQTWRWSRLDAGPRSIEWSGKTEGAPHVPAGALIVRFTADGRSIVRKAVRLP